jgi:MFS family permease
MLKGTAFIKKYKWLYAVSFLGEVYFAIPTWWFFYSQFLHLSDQQIVIITLVQAFSVLFFEVPTGALADLMGRLKTNIFSYALYIVLLLLTIFTRQFELLLLLAVAKGFANALLSGSWEALTYDTLKDNGDEENYSQFVSDTRFLFWIAYFVSSLFGGYLYSWNPVFPWLFTAFSYLLTLIIMQVFIKEPKVETEEQKTTLKVFLKQNFAGYKELFAFRKVAIVVVIFLVVRIGYYFASELIGIKQAESLGFTAEQVGLIFSVGCGISAILSLLYSRVVKKIGRVTVIVVAGLVISLSYSLILPAVPIIGMFMIIARTVTATTFLNTVSEYLNKNISSKNRATALSTFNMFVQIGYFVLSGLFLTLLPITGIFVFSNYLGYSIGVLLVVIGIVWLMDYMKSVNANKKVMK